MKTIQIILDILAIIIFAAIAISGEKISAWFVVLWIIIAMLDHLLREE